MRLAPSCWLAQSPVGRALNDGRHASESDLLDEWRGLCTGLSSEQSPRDQNFELRVIVCRERCHPLHIFAQCQDAKLIQHLRDRLHKYVAGVHRFAKTRQSRAWLPWAWRSVSNSRRLTDTRQQTREFAHCRYTSRIRGSRAWM